MVMCASMTTIRKFVRHIAPSLMAGSVVPEAQDETVDYARAHHSAPSDNKSTHRHSKYATFGDDLEMNDMPEINRKSNSNLTAGEGGFQTDDGDSQKGILQTKTVTVQYNKL